MSVILHFVNILQRAGKHHWRYRKRFGRYCFTF